MKEIFVNGRHDYSLKIEGDVYSLFYSPDQEWNRPNGLIMTLKDTGNGFKIQQKKKNYLEFDEALELAILFNVIHLIQGYKIEMVETKIELK